MQGTERAEAERANRQVALRLPLVEHLIQTGCARARAAQQAQHVVVDGTRVGLCQPGQRAQRLWAGAFELGARVGASQHHQRRQAATLGLCALGQQLGQHRPELRVAHGQRQRAGGQARALNIFGLQAARDEFATALAQCPLHAVQEYTRRRVALGELGMHMLDDRPRHARVGGDTGRAQQQARGGAARAEAEQQRADQQQAAAQTRRARYGNIGSIHARAPPLPSPPRAKREVGRRDPAAPCGVIANPRAVPGVFQGAAQRRWPCVLATPLP